MPFVIPQVNLVPLLPALIPALAAMAIMLADAWRSEGNEWGLGLVAVAGTLLAMIATVGLWDRNLTAFGDSIRADNFSLALLLVVLGATLLALLLSFDFVQARRLVLGEYLALLLSASAGMGLMVLANDLMIIFLALELFSLALYVLSAFWRANRASLEAGIKYFLLGAFSSSFFLYGIAFVYGATSTTNLTEIVNALSRAGTANNTLLLMGVGLLIVGFGFKVALVPFQWWTPDVYEGAPTPVTAFMSAATKTAAFAAFFRAFVVAIPQTLLDWQMVMAILAVVTMTVGNIAALVQTNLKRLLAYSSIAHAGYILIALVAGDAEGTAALVFYLVAYSAMTLGAFGAIIALGQSTRERITFEDLAGAAQYKPWAAAALTICLLSLAGFPPFAGFVAKFFLFRAAVVADFTWLAVIGVLNSLISVYYYLGPVIRMYMGVPAEGWEGGRTPRGVVLAVGIAVVITLALGLLPFNALQLAQAAALK